jgi:hypothetical protein
LPYCSDEELEDIKRGAGYYGEEARLQWQREADERRCAADLIEERVAEEIEDLDGVIKRLLGPS